MRNCRPVKLSIKRRARRPRGGRLDAAQDCARTRAVEEVDPDRSVCRGMVLHHNDKSFRFLSTVHQAPAALSGVSNTYYIHKGKCQYEIGSKQLVGVVAASTSTVERDRWLGAKC